MNFFKLLMQNTQGIITLQLLHLIPYSCNISEFFFFFSMFICCSNGLLVHCILQHFPNKNKHAFAALLAFWRLNFIFLQKKLLFWQLKRWN